MTIRWKSLPKKTAICKPSKYRNKPVIIDNIRFPSIAEGDYYWGLKLRERENDIKYFLRQVPIYLPGGVRYVVDFVVFENDGTVRYIDVKGKETDMFKLKKKQVEALYPIKIEVVK